MKRSTSSSRERESVIFVRFRTLLVRFGGVAGSGGWNHFPFFVDKIAGCLFHSSGAA